MNQPALELRQVSKQYRKIVERSLLRTLWPFGRPARTEVVALDNVSVDIAAGEAVGIIGKNGAGKSTLLRIMSGVTQPTLGEAVIRGRVAPMLSVGVGFHPEMTGRENVFINGMLLGLTRDEVTSRFDEIVDFADIPGFIDTPVKFYSSGMFMRLGFAVAVHSSPDILIIDEVLAVGDNAFQLRSLNQIRSMADAGTTIVFVSHSMHAVHLLCPRTLFVHRGRVAFDGSTEEAIARYHSTLAAPTDDADALVVFSEPRLVDPAGRTVDSIDQAQELQFTVNLTFRREFEGPGIWFHVLAGDGSHAYSLQTPVGDKWRTFPEGEAITVSVRFKPRLGGGGTFHINLDVTEADGTIVASTTNAAAFYVPPLLGVSGPADLSGRILIDGEELPQTWTRLGGAALPTYEGQG